MIHLPNKPTVNKSVTILLIFSLLINCIGVFFVGKRIYWSYFKDKKQHNSVIDHMSATPPGGAYYLNRDKLYDILPVDSGAIIFLGNSITQNYPVTEFFYNPRIFNRGINLDNVKGISKRLHSITKCHPKKIFLEIGVNDLGAGSSADSVIANYYSLLKLLQKECSGSEIYIQSILPVSNKSALLPTYCNKKMNSDILKVNNAIRHACGMYKILFIDSHPYFLLGNEMNPKLTVDGVHLSADGYILLTKILTPFVNK